MDILIVAVLTFACCYLADKGFHKLFRSKAQHKSGLSVRISKYFSVAGILLLVLGAVGLFTGIDTEGWELIVGSSVVILIGLLLNVGYMSFGLFYDEDSLVYTSFGRKSVTYSFGDIVGQQLYRSGRTVIVELHFADGKTIDLHSTMTGVYPFLDAAFAGWCRQKGLDPADCSFHDPENSCWFPAAEEGN